MPIYDYKCNKCGHRFSQMNSIKDRNNASCPKCKSKEVKLVIAGCSVNTGGCGTGTSVPAGGG